MGLGTLTNSDCTVLVFVGVNAVEGRNDIMCTTIIDFLDFGKKESSSQCQSDCDWISMRDHKKLELTRMTGANRDSLGSTINSSSDPTGTVLEYQAFLNGVSQLLGS